ncbi:MAG: hypothetical protein ACLTSK_02940 [Christensenellales bacterium]
MHKFNIPATTVSELRTIKIIDAAVLNFSTLCPVLYTETVMPIAKNSCTKPAAAVESP